MRLRNTLQAQRAAWCSYRDGIRYVAHVRVLLQAFLYIQRFKALQHAQHLTCFHSTFRAGNVRLQQSRGKFKGEVYTGISSS